MLFMMPAETIASMYDGIWSITYNGIDKNKYNFITIVSSGNQTKLILNTVVTDPNCGIPALTGCVECRDECYMWQYGPIIINDDGSFKFSVRSIGVTQEGVTINCAGVFSNMKNMTARCSSGVAGDRHSFKIIGKKIDRMKTTP